jgi:hypothetical protein
MSGLNWKGHDITEIISQSGNVQYGNYKKADGNYLTCHGPYGGTLGIDPTPGDVTEAYLVNGQFPGGRTAATHYGSGSSALTPPSWARSFKLMVYARNGSTGPKNESSQGGQRGPNTGTAGHSGRDYYSNTYTPITSSTFYLSMSNADNGFNGVQHGSVKMGANNGGHGQPYYEGHTNTPGSYGPAGPGATAVHQGTNASYTSPHYNQNSIYTAVYWFS